MEYTGVWDEVVHFLTSGEKNPEYPDDYLQWYKKVLDYNVTGGKMNRAKAVMDTFQTVADEDTLNDINMKKARILGWCLELLQAMALVADDMMDGSETRRGRPCWYKTNSLGALAIRDVRLLEASIFLVIKHYFRTEDYYSTLHKVTHNVRTWTTQGQCLDLKSSLEGTEHSPNRHSKVKEAFAKFTLDRYKNIVKYKTSYYTFYLPVAFGMLLAGMADKESLKIMEKATLKIGEFFQIQDDYLDCFGDPAVTGKVGTDIQDGKCSWLIVQALQLADSDQIKILEDNFAINSAEKVAAVKTVYEEIDIPSVYAKCEKQYDVEIQNMIDEIQQENYRILLKKLYDRICGRSS